MNERIQDDRLEAMGPGRAVWTGKVMSMDVDSSNNNSRGNRLGMDFRPTKANCTLYNCTEKDSQILHNSSF